MSKRDPKRARRPGHLFGQGGSRNPDRSGRAARAGGGGRARRHLKGGRQGL